MLRRGLHALYTLCGYAAAAFLAAIAVVTLWQIVARQIGMAIETTEIAGFCLAASTFLALAHTFVNGGHVRISLVSQFAPPHLRRAVEIWCCALAAGVTGYAAWQMVLFTLQSHDFGDLSPGMVAMPLWIPQSGVAFGLVVLTVAIAEQATLVIRGQAPGYATNIDGTVD
ncbi:TRAP transporter small permease [Jannaschia rubra]|nr:TRAP transporter small permease [Jannaschia rubra]